MGHPGLSAYFNSQCYYALLEVDEHSLLHLLPLICPHLLLQLILRLLDELLADSEVPHRVYDVEILVERIQLHFAHVVRVLLNARLEDPVIQIESPGEVGEPQ